MNVTEQLEHLDSLLLSTVVTKFPAPLTDAEKAATNAYVVMGHAVLEEFIEDAFEQHFDRLASWLEAPLVPLEAARLMFAMGEWLPEKLRVPYKTRTLKGASTPGRKHFASAVRNNHGLKSDNIQDLSKLIGLDWPSLSSALSLELADLNTLASKRGEAGHLSPYTEKAVKITRVSYPDEVRTWMLDAWKAAQSLAGYLTDLIGQQMPQTLICDWDGN